MKKLRPCLAILALILMGHNSAQALENECGANAQIDGASYILSPSGGDDTATIQCALDSAVSQGIPTVRLDRGSFYTSELRTYGFKGTFTGTTRNDSVLLINNDIADCGTTFPIIAFLGGDVQVRSMTIDTEAPCLSGDNLIVLYFSQESCSKRTVFGLVDRVNLINTFEGKTRAIQMTGQLSCLEEAKGPLGTFKLNRSELRNFAIGVYTSLYGAGQVDINFNDFSDTNIGIMITDASQSTTITGNTIDYRESAILSGSPTSFSARANRTVIHNNTLNQTPGTGRATAIKIFNEYRLVEHSAVVTNNTLNLSRDTADQYGVAITDIDGAIVSGNTFRGQTYRAIFIESLFFSDPSENNAILGNTFSASTSDTDILVGFGALNTVVGSQNAYIENYGINSLIGF